MHRIFANIVDADIAKIYLLLNLFWNQKLALFELMEIVNTAFCQKNIQNLDKFIHSVDTFKVKM